MKAGARPLARLETGSGFFQAGVFLPDVGSIGLSFSASLRDAPWTPGSLSRSSASRPTSRTNDAQASAIMKRRQPFPHLLEQAGGTENEDRRHNEQPETHKRRLLCRSNLQPKSASNRKNAVGVGVSP